MYDIYNVLQYNIIESRYSRMNGLLMMTLALIVLVASYIVYGGWLAKKWGIDPKAKTPAHELNDGVDYVGQEPDPESHVDEAAEILRAFGTKPGTGWR